MEPILDLQGALSEKWVLNAKSPFNRMSGAVGICIVWIMTNKSLIYESVIYNVGRRQQEGDTCNLGVLPIQFDHNAVRTFTMQLELQCLLPLSAVVKTAPAETNTFSIQKSISTISRHLGLETKT